MGVGDNLCVCPRESLRLPCCLLASCLIFGKLLVAALRERLTAEPRTSGSVWAVGLKFLVFWSVVLIYERLCALCALSSLRHVKLENAEATCPWALERYGLS